MPRRIAVIGGAGFIGRHLVRRLGARGASIRVIGLHQPEETHEWARCDVRDAAGLRDAFDGVELVYNLAAAHGLNTHAPEVYQTINVEGARNVCEAATAAGVGALVFTSTADVYGRAPFVDEHSPLAATADYGRSKAEAEGIYRAWARQSPERSLVIVRPTVVFGPGGDGAVARFIRHVAGPDFAHYGESGNRRSMACVENLAEFLSFIGAPAVGERIFNYADVPDLAVAEIVSIVRAAVGLAPAPRRSLAGAYVATFGATLKAGLTGRPRPTLPTMRGMVRQLGLERRLDASRAHATGFTPPLELREALAATARQDARWVALLTRARA